MCGRQPLKNLMEYDLPKAEDLEKCFEPLNFWTLNCPETEETGWFFFQEESTEN